ncbi:MAG: PHP domain-containing protein [Firmicutes bacterium]|nr:PHP domain-containing protein [Bacillota bacterium]
MGWLDLHLHSNCSDDGQYTPGELMTICSQSGVKTAAVTDHNSTRGVAEARKAAASLGISLIPGVELDCLYQGVGLHVLGYWIDEGYPQFLQIEKSIIAQEQKAAAERIEKVRALGIHVDSEAAFALATNGVVTGEIIAEVVLQQDENADNPLLAAYRADGNRSDNPYVNFYWDFCSQGKPAFVPINFLSLEEIIEVIRSAGGIAVLAHPGNNVKEDATLLQNIEKQGIAGLEVFSSYHTPAQTAFYREAAEDLGLAMSCGSDFHGKTKPAIAVGSVDCDGAESAMLAALQERCDGFFQR